MIDKVDASEAPLPATQLLVVEDNDLDVELLIFHLRRSGLQIPIVRAHHGEEALKLITDAYADDSHTQYVILLDLNMPRMGGFELLSQLCEESWYPELAIYILTTSDEQVDRKQASNYQVRDYLLKPVTADILSRVIADSDS